MIRRSLLLCAALASACGGSPTRPPADATAAQIAAANQRLQGTWILMQFQPELALEPMLAELLALQMGRLAVRFEGKQALITGVGVETERSYRVLEADYDRLKIVLTDPSGVAYQSSGQFFDNELHFHSDTSPWRGRGILKRSPNTP